jgi:hypothetical protein
MAIYARLIQLAPDQRFIDERGYVDRKRKGQEWEVISAPWRREDDGRVGIMVRESGDPASWRDLVLGPRQKLCKSHVRRVK